MTEPAHRVPAGTPEPAPSRGLFVTLEGIDGAGKSSHLSWATQWLMTRGVDVVTTREPGGTALGEKIRALLLNDTMTLKAECLLLFAARAEHLAVVIEPALARGSWVISDRFTDATFAYQCGGRGADPKRIAVLEQWTQEGLSPDRTWLFDISVNLAAQRREQRDGSAQLDRFEAQETSFHQRVRGAYLDRMIQEPERFMHIDSSTSIDSIRQQLEQDLEALLRRQIVSEG